jgi:hypothetical protein
LFLNVAEEYVIDITGTPIPLVPNWPGSNDPPAWLKLHGRTVAGKAVDELQQKGCCFGLHSSEPKGMFGLQKTF